MRSMRHVGVGRWKKSVFPWQLDQFAIDCAYGSVRIVFVFAEDAF